MFPVVKKTGGIGGDENEGEECPQLNIPKTIDLLFFKPEACCFLTIVPPTTESKWATLHWGDMF